MNLSGLLAVCALVPALAVDTFTSAAAAADDPVKSPSAASADIPNHRRAFTVRVMASDQNGSGVIIKTDQNGAWIVTNRHVIGTSKLACIATSSGQYYDALIYSRRESPNDLAFVFIPEPPRGLSSAVLATTNYTDIIANVTATGFSAPEHRYTESIGLTLPLLDKPVQGGYGLVYSSQINKGMSGGGVFNKKGELIGINANHSDPLWTSEWLDGQGQPLAKELSDKLDAASVGIASNLIAAELRRVMQAYASPAKLGEECKKHQPGI